MYRNQANRYIPAMRLQDRKFTFARLGGAAGRYLLIILLLDLIFLAGRVIYILYGDLDLHTEEAQYWLWSKHMAWSYYSKPPLVAWANYLAGSMLGNTELAGKANALFVGFVLPWLLYWMTLDLFRSHRLAFYSVLILFVMPYYNYISLVFMTDTYSFFFWLLAVYFTWKALYTDRKSAWLLSGLAFGMGWLSKYTMLLLLPVIAIYAVINIRRGKSLRNIPVFLIAIFLFSLPEIIWNWKHQFVSFRHLIDLSSVGEFQVQLTSMSKGLIEYLGGQLLLFSPFFIPLFIKGLMHWRVAIRRHAVVAYLMGIWLGVIGFFLLLSPNGVYINWTLFAFAPMPIVLAYFTLQQESFRQVAWAWVLTLLVQVVGLNPGLLDAAGMGALYPPEKDALKRMVGWQDISRHVDQVLPEDSSYFIFSDNYHVASEMAFYLNQPHNVFCINEGRRMNQFDLWPGIDQFAHKNYRGIYISRDAPEKSVIEAFEKVERYDTLQIYHRGQPVREFYLVVLNSFKGYSPVSTYRY